MNVWCINLNSLKLRYATHNIAFEIISLAQLKKNQWQFHTWTPQGVSCNDYALWLWHPSAIMCNCRFRNKIDTIVENKRQSAYDFLRSNNFCSNLSVWVTTMENNFLCFSIHLSSSHQIDFSKSRFVQFNVNESANQFFVVAKLAAFDRRLSKT